MDFGLGGRVAVVPGATSGLGLASARALAAEGADVVIGGRRAALAQEEAAALPSAVGVAVDLTDPSGPETLVGAAADAFGPVDVLVLNGGGPAPGTAAGMTSGTAAAAVDLLLLPHVRLVEAVLPRMRERGWGRIIAIGSSGVQQPLDGLAASNVGRAALAGYLKTLAGEVAADGVTVNMVLPGRIDTERLASLERARADRQGADIEAVRAASQADIPVGRYGTPDEFGAVVAFLASGAASYVTGAQIRCDGGLVRAH
ncbi:SDR family oxidoreductase [Nocardiopsis sediminis]|uniref:SDR family oxidoreductase n=1 Tax=Nocardiopsis sediminis TaxID=1778267 RepID=A0ABV8FWT7_9ACTN